MRSQNPKFTGILHDLSNARGKNMFSFASKMCAKADLNWRVVDSHVVQSLSLKRPSGGKVADRIRKSIELYEQLNTAYKVFLKPTEGKQVVILFNKKIGSKRRFKIKKLTLFSGRLLFVLYKSQE